MKLSEMYGDQDTRTFEERRAEVVSIIRSAADFEGAESGLRAIFLTMSAADDEPSFDAAFEALASSLSENATRYLQAI
jgi:hypothetical protein